MSTTSPNFLKQVMDRLSTNSPKPDPKLVSNGEKAYEQSKLASEMRTICATRGNDPVHLGGNRISSKYCQQHSTGVLREKLQHNSIKRRYVQEISTTDMKSLTEEMATLDLRDKITRELDGLSEPVCAYCGIHDPDCLVFCKKTGKWFCNGLWDISIGSHIIVHLSRARANEVMLHKNGLHKGMRLKCSVCGSTNVFELGFIPGAPDPLRLMCRLACGDRNQEHVTRHHEQWEPVIKGRKIVTSFVKVPSGNAQINAQRITVEQIDQLEEMWTTNPNATVRDIKQTTFTETVGPVLLRYQSASDYHRTFSALLKLEAAEDKKTKELVKYENVVIRVEEDITNCPVVYLCIPGLGEASDTEILLGDKVTIFPTKATSVTHSFVGTVIMVPDGTNNEIGVEISNMPTYICKSDRFTVQLTWRPASFNRMTAALNRVLLGSHLVPPFLISRLLGNEAVNESIKLESSVETPAIQLPKLNKSQSTALRMVLQNRLSLIQGPPGTGKTVTAACVVYHLRRIHDGKVLAVAPSNTAIDHLCEKISGTGLKVVRVCSASREKVPSSMKKLMLDEQALHLPDYKELLDLHRMRRKRGFVSGNDEIRYQRLKKQAEAEVLRRADVVCCTCVTAGNCRLEDVTFKSVLVDESTQAIEPECLIPLSTGCSHIVLVGDHCQLGPVVKCQKAAKAGLTQSLFERLLRLGVPSTMLQVQYRMHPALSEFSSRVFYGGQLNNGVSDNDRINGIAFPWPNSARPMLFYCQFGGEEIAANGVSFLNRHEAATVEKIVTRLLRGGVKPESMGVIVPYEGQRAFLVRYFEQRGSLEDRKSFKAVKIDSVDAFQGQEKDYIILSCVRSNEIQAIGFLKEPRRLNVALTRARYGLIIVGDASTLCKNPLWNTLIHFYSDRNVLVHGDLSNLTKYNPPTPAPSIPYTYQPGSNLSDCVD